MEKDDVGRIYKELLDEACEYVFAGLTFHDFFTKHEVNKAKKHLLLRHGLQFSQLWKNLPLCKEVKKPAYSLEETMDAYLKDNEVPEKDNPIEIIE